MQKRGFGLYLHIPFCVRKCLYCSFFSIANGNEKYERYCKAVQQQLKGFAKYEWAESREVCTIFFGGGTPSILPPSLLISLLDTCREAFDITDDTFEISLEVNPATVNEQDLQQLLKAGFNRLSIGIQSFSDRELQLLGRPHTAEDARRAVTSARRAGFSNISLDLMYGLPGQTVKVWRETLKSALELEPDHLSIYELMIEEGSVFATMRHRGKLSIPDDDQVLDMMDITMNAVSKNGFQRYEISNYARQGKECLHNINYWQNGSYLGAGAGAVSCRSGRRYTGVADIEEYCRKIEYGQPPHSDIEDLGNEARFRETVIMGLRMIKGVSIQELSGRFGKNLTDYYGETLQHLEDSGFVTIRDGYLRLTEKGLLLANRVMTDLV